MNEMLPHPDLLQHLGIGNCLLGPEDEIIEVDNAWREIFMISQADIAGRRLTDFYVNPGDAPYFRQQLIQHRRAQSTVILMSRETGEWFFAEITARALFDRSGSFQGQEAIVRDVTQTEVRNRIVEWLPVGFYMVQVNNGRHLITYCNSTFGEMFGFNDRTDALQYEIVKLYQNPSDFDEFLVLIAESEEDNNTRQVNVKTIQDKRFIVEATVKWTKDANGNIVDRYGLIRDLTHDMPLKELRTNLANVLHTYTNNQIPVHFVLQGAIDVLGPGPFDPARRPTEDLILTNLGEPFHAMVGSLKAVNDFLSGLDIQDEIVESMFELEDALDQVYPRDIAFQLYLWLDIAKKVRGRVRNADTAYHIPKPTLDSLLKSAAELERLVLLVLLIYRDTDFIEIDQEVRLFNAYLNAGERTGRDNQNAIVDLVTIVKQACNDMWAFAISRDINIEGPRVTTEMNVFANGRDLLRVVSNVIHNAVKYSWEPRRRDPGGRKVRARLIEESDEFVLRVTNFGVPVPPDELKIVFKSGYRGRLATDRGRLGSGVGLSDAKSVIERYGGRIYLESKPVSQAVSSSRPDEPPPHITTVWIHLPKYEGDK